MSTNDVTGTNEIPALAVYPLKRPRVRRNGFGRHLWTVEVPGRMTRRYCRTWREALAVVRGWHWEQTK
jgi:hypothetical protein